MIAEEKKQEVLAAIAQVQDEAVFARIAAVVQSILGQSAAPRPLSPPGFAADESFWMADDFDEPLEDFKDYQ